MEADSICYSESAAPHVFSNSVKCSVVSNEGLSVKYPGGGGRLQLNERKEDEILQSCCLMLFVPSL